MTDMSMRNDPTADVSRLLQAATESLTDNMVERLSITAANGLEVVDRLNNEDTKDAVLAVLDNLTELHRTGALDTLFQVIKLAHGCREAMTDSMVERLFAFMESMVNNLANEEVADLAHNARQAMAHASKEAAGHKASGGLFATVSMLSQPETQQAMQFLLSFACKMRSLSIDDRGGT